MPLGESRRTDGAIDRTDPARGGGTPGDVPAPELPLAERRRRRREAVIAALVLAAIAAVVAFESRLSRLGTSLPIGDGMLFLFLNAVTVILIGLLVFLITRNFVKLVFERRRGILGSHLNTRFVLAFLLIATVPTAVLFAVSAFFITSSIDTWFSLQVDDALEQSRAVADEFYESASRDALFYGRRIAEQVRAEDLLADEQRARLAELVQAKQREYNLGVVEVFSSTGEELVAASNPEIPAANFSRPESDLVQSALAGSSLSTISALGGADVIRGAVPIQSAAMAEKIVGAVVVNTFVPRSLTRRVAEIRAALDEYRRLQPNAGHIRTVYLLELLLIFLVVLLLATWWGLRMAKGVTGPIRALVEGTDQVARGNLDVVVEATSEDEVGFLVRSFNQMTHDLRDARTGLERSTAEIEQRRRYMEVVLRNIGAGVVSVDAEGRISTINPAAQRLLGVLPGVGLAGRKIADVLTRPEHVELVGELAAQLRPGLRESIRRQLQVPSGDEVLTLVVSLTLLQDDDGRRLGMVLVFDDTTQLVKVQRMAAWREVARRIAHEIKNPLTPIQLSAQRIRRRFRERLAHGTEDARVFDECVETITTQVDSLKLLVNEFSNFARLPTASPKPDDLNRLVADTVASYAGTEGVELRTQLDPALVTVELDREQMRRALSNLIENAIAAIREPQAEGGAPGTGEIELRTVYDEALGTARLEVADDGPGIRPDDRRRIFEPYFSTRRGHGPRPRHRLADRRGPSRLHSGPRQPASGNPVRCRVARAWRLSQAMADRILIVDDEESIRRSLAGILSDEGFEPVTASDADHALVALRSDPAPALVLLDIAMPGRDGLDLLEEIHALAADLPIVMMSGHGTIETAVRATKLGAYDFIEKPLSVDKLLLTIQHALRHAGLARENRTLRAEALRAHEILGESDVVRRLKEQIALAAPTNGWVLITGENGTGKELVARQIHLQSKRADRPFVEVNCAAIPEELIESELFGHEKGAFTGAIVQKRGKFEVAHTGTIFLDEIADMSLKTQAKILRILQEHKFERVGGTEPMDVDVRVIAATNKSLEKEIAAGRFREDLYYRLAVIPFHVAPLRERREDIPILVAAFVREFCAEAGVREKAIGPRAMNLLQGYAWPGNVRELRNLVERLVLMTPGTRVEASDLPESIRSQEAREGAEGEGLEGARRAFEREYLVARLRDHGWNISRTAEAIGLARESLSRKIRSYKIEIQRD